MPGIAAESCQPGPLERTVVELGRIEREAAFACPRTSRTRRSLREADGLLHCIEECRLRGLRLVPTAVFGSAVRLLALVDPGLRGELGSDRRLDHVSDTLFIAQEELLHRRAEEGRGRLAPIIPLFAERREACAGGL